MTVLRVDPRALVPSTLRPPRSKSDLQRALTLAHVLARPELCPLPQGGSALPDDVQVLARGLAALREGRAATLDCSAGGTPLRFLVGQAAIAGPGPWEFTGSARLAERPLQPLLEALVSALGAHGFSARPGAPWPLLLTPATSSGEPRLDISGKASSQFVSSLLFVAAALARGERRPWTVGLVGPVASSGYVDLTVHWLRLGGFQVDVSASSLVVAFAREVDALPGIPGDWSSLGYLLLVAWRSQGLVLDLDPSAAHPDRAILTLLSNAGLSLASEPDGHRVRGRAKSGVTITGKSCPDLLPTVAALACVLPEPSILLDTDILRHKESDRLAGIIELVEAAGGTCTPLGGGRLTLTPPREVPDELVLDSHQDHRLAMAASTLAVLLGRPLRLSGPECVSKSFPDFWGELAGAGVRLETVAG